jgi:hypothetical protein
MGRRRAKDGVGPRWETQARMHAGEHTYSLIASTSLLKEACALGVQERIMRWGDAS